MSYSKTQHLPGPATLNPMTQDTLLTSIQVWLKTGREWQNPSGAQVTREQMP